MQPMHGAQMEIQAGAMIFAEGDPGGDLYFVKEGEVEVFREAHGRRIVLATLMPGEVLGIMTCLTREPRLASARALTAVKLLMVKQAGIKTLITSTPPWVHTVIKDFILRIKHMDDCYTRAVEQLGVESADLSLVRLGAMLARGLGEIGALQSPVTAPGEPRIVDVDAAMARLAGILAVPLATLETVFAVFVDVGMLKADKGAAIRRADLGVLERIGVYADVCRGYLEGSDGIRAFEGLTERDQEFLLGLGGGAKHAGHKLTQSCQLPVSKLVGDGFPTEYATDALTRAEAAHLVSIDRSGAEMAVTFTPTTVSGSVRSLRALHKFRAMDAERREANIARMQNKAAVATEAF